MKDVIIRSAVQDDAVDLAPRLRDSDLNELAASSGDEPLDILKQAIEISSHCWAARRVGHTQVLFGAAPVTDEVGSIWLLGSDDIYCWPKEFVRLSHIYVSLMHERYIALTNFVDDRNQASQLWLRRLGFKPGTHVPEYGVGKLPFTQYTSVRT